MTSEITPAQTQQQVEEDELDLRQLLDVLIAGKWWIVGITIGVVILGLFYLWRAEPIYSTNALVQVQNQQSSSLAEFSNEQQAMGMPQSSHEADIQILQSRSVIGKTVDQLNLQISAKPHYFPILGQAIARHRAPGNGDLASPLFGLDSYAWGGDSIKVTRLNLPQRLMGRRLTLVALGQGRYRLLDPAGHELLQGQVGKPAHASAQRNLSIFVQKLHAQPGTRFDVHKVPWLVAVDALQAKLNVQEKGRDSGVLSLSLDGPNPKHITKQLNAIANTYMRQNVEEHTQTAQKRLTFVKQQLPKLRKKLNQDENRLNNYREKHKAVDITDETQSLLSQEVNVEQQLTQLDQERAELQQGFTSLHPKRRALKSQRQQLLSLKASLENQISRLPKTQQAILRMERDVQVNSNLYTNLLNESQELQITKAGTVGNVRVIDHAVQPLAPILPKRSLVLVLSLVLGLLAGVAFILARWKLRRGVMDPNEIESRIGVPIYAVVPHSKALSGETRRAQREKRALPIMARQHPQDLSMESLRSLRTSLHFALMDAETNVICITGPSPAIGKSFISINLGLLLAQAGQRVLIVDADMRKGHLHQYIGEKREPGLSDILAGAAKREDVIHSMDEENAFLLTGGAIPPNPSELLMSDRFSALLKQLEQEFDVVLVDTPPIMAVTDASIIAPKAGATFMVIKAGGNPMAEIERAVKRLSGNGVRTTGVVFNDVPQGSAGYGYQSSGYYQYKYE